MALTVPSAPTLPSRSPSRLARGLAPYREVLTVPGVAVIEVVGALGRVPAMAAGVVCILHVVQTLGLGYGAAGVVGAATTIGTAVSSPWRGRAVDRLGLRRAVVPTAIAQAVCWSVAPFLPYAGLLVAAFASGVLGPPVFTAVRQSLAVLVPVSRRGTAFALDAMLVELAYMVGPAAGTAVALHFSTTAAMLCVGAAQFVSAVAMVVVDPPVRSAGTSVAEESVAPAAGARRVWTTGLLLAMACAFAADLVLSATDLAVLVQLREGGAVRWTGLVLALWAAGSVVGGLVYGALGRTVSPWLLVSGLGLATLPLALVRGPFGLAVAIFVAGIFCTPIISATLDLVVQGVHESARGRAMGWHAAAATTGAALGAPLAGMLSDATGPGATLVAAGVLGVLAGAAAAVVAARTGFTRRCR